MPTQSRSSDKWLICTAVALATLAAAAPARAGSDNRLADHLPIFSAGSDAGYLIKPYGSVWAWGNNSAGEIGDGTGTTRKNPVSISIGCAQISAGNSFVLCIGQDGTLWSWGLNGYSQLGRTGNINVPTQVGGNMDYRTVQAGYSHGLAIKYDGTLWAWGDNGQGQLGLGDTTTRTTPTKVGSDDNWIALAAGSGFSLALKADGTLYGCGNNNAGQLATGNTNTGPKTFTKIGTMRWKSVAAGLNHVMAIREDGHLYTWGSNTYGQIGNNANNTNAVTTPYKLTPSSGPGVWRAVAPGYQHSVAIQADGTLWAWGANTHGEVGLGTTGSPQKKAVQVGTAHTAQYVAAGMGFTLLIRADGTLMTWGQNLYGTLADGTSNDRATMGDPFQYYDGDLWNYAVKPQLPGAGGAFSMLVARDGELLNWGWNFKGQLGDGTTTDSAERRVPAARNYDYDWMTASGGDNASHAIKGDGTMWSWGTSQNGELGTGVATNTKQLTPKQVGSENIWVKVSDHYAQSIGLRADGTLWAAGDNVDGRLGVGIADANVLTFTKVSTPAGKYWAAVAVSENNAYGIRTDGTLWSWGKNDQKQLGRGTSNASGATTPVQISLGANDWVAVGAGLNFAVAVRANGQAFAWGLNDSGQLGIGSLATPKSTPQKVQGGYLITLLATTRNATLGASAYGNVVGWGDDSHGELGIGGEIIQSAQTTSFWGSRAMAGGDSHIIEVNTYSMDGYAAGLNGNGQLGDGSTTSEVWPEQIFYTIYY